MEEGWIKLHRSLKSWRYYKVSGFVSLWFHLLMEAHHGDSPVYDGFGNTINKGQLSTGILRLSRETGLSKGKVERILSKLEIENQIRRQRTSKCSIITICCWEQYQNTGSETGSRQEADRKQTGSRQEQNKNVKNVKNERMKEYNTCDPTKIIDIWNRTFSNKKFNAFSFGSGTHMQNFFSINEIFQNQYGHVNISHWVDYFSKISESKFLMEKNFGILWFLNPDNYLNVVSGKYSDRSSKIDYSFLDDADPT